MPSLVSWNLSECQDVTVRTKWGTTHHTRSPGEMGQWCTHSPGTRSSGPQHVFKVGGKSLIFHGKRPIHSLVDWWGWRSQESKHIHVVKNLSGSVDWQGEWKRERILIYLVSNLFWILFLSGKIKGLGRIFSISIWLINSQLLFLEL